MKDILSILDGKWEDGTRPKDLYNLYISKKPTEYLETIVEGLNSSKRKVQSGCAELASLLSEDTPEILYPHLELFISNLDAKAPVLRWKAVCIIGNLAPVDKKKAIPSLVDKISFFLDDKSIVLQGHSVRALTKISKAFPETAPTAFKRLTASANRFPGNRVGFIVEAMEAFADYPELVEEARDFVESYADSDIKSVARKANRTLKKLG
ncbi:MAG: hypothetical protein JSW61_08910 [Candidatus Thorarchaeota archaeon]|nr:MAG: hypothetical protein JSW61_08910 [Candidatus Thorarchaeota archaeon]